MTSGWIMLGLGTLICGGVFANGVRFARLGERLPQGDGARARIVRRLYGQLAMVSAPLFWLLWAALCFGLFGPLDKFQTIKLH